MARIPHVWPPEDEPGPHVRLTNADKVLYPATGTTKEEVFGYYTSIAEHMLTHIAGRPATRKRWPNGVQEASFFEKQLAESAPAWLNRATIEHRSGATTYPIIDSPAAMAWIAQQAALEVHVPQWRFEPARSPARPGYPFGVRSRSRSGRPDDAACRRCAGGARHVGRHRPSHISGHQRQQGPASVCPARQAARRPRCDDAGEEGGPAARAGLAEVGHVDDDEKCSGGQGLRRLEPEQRVEDDGRAVLVARPSRTHRRGAAHLGGTRRSRPAPAAVRRGADARRHPRRPVGAVGCGCPDVRPADEIPQLCATRRERRSPCRLRNPSPARTTDS